MGINIVNNKGENNGIIAGQINIGNTQRHLNDEYKNKLTEFLLDKKPEIIKITSTNNTESYQYAVEVKDFLKGKNFSVENNIDQSILAGPVDITAQVENDYTIHIFIN